MRRRLRLSRSVAPFRSESSNFLVTDHSRQVRKYFSTTSDLLLLTYAETGLAHGGRTDCHIFIHFKTMQRRGSLSSNAGVGACSYLRVFEERGDASDVKTEAPRRASRSVNTGSEERVVLFPRAHTPRAH